MATYKVHIATDGDKTSYTTNGHILAEVSKTTGGYKMTSDCIKRTFATPAEAEAAARSAVTNILGLVGCVPMFINE